MSKIILSQLLLQEYIWHYEAEKERIRKVQALQDTIQAKATQIILEWIDFEIIEAQEEIDLYITNNITHAS